MAEEIKNPEDQKTEETQFNIESFNQWSEQNVGQKFEDEGSLKNVFESINGYESKIKAKDEEIDSYKPYKDKYETYIQKVKDILPDTDTVAINQLKDKYQGVNIGVLSQIRTADLNSMDNLSALLLANKVEVPSNASDEIRVKGIFKQLGIENELGELTDDDRFLIDNALAGKKSILNEIRQFQPEGVDFDFEKDWQSIQDEKKAQTESKAAEVKALTDHNQKMLKPILDGFKEIQIPYKSDKGEESAVKYVVDDKFRSEFMDEAVQDLTSQGFKITSENSNEVADYLNKEYIVSNFNTIITSVISQVLGQKQEEHHKENHNDSSENKTEAPVVDGKKLPPTARESMRSWGKNRQNK